MHFWIGNALMVLALLACGYTLAAGLAVLRMGRRPIVRGLAEPVTLLKPLYGAEPRLADNLATFLDQDWDAPIQMVAGVQRSDDPAREAISFLRHPRESGDPAATSELGSRLRGNDEDIELIVDPTPHGANAKVANLINMTPAARHDLIVLSDSDMAVPRDYLTQLSGALAAPGVGAVSCLYRGRGDAGPWSRIAAAHIDYQFLPSVLVGMAMGLAHPCMGSTIALRRRTLDAIGGFAAFRDDLADDYAIGAAVRGLGLTVAVPPMLLTHACTETSLSAVWRHELRWAATIRSIDLPGTIGAVLTHPVPLALLACAFTPKQGAVALVVAVAARAWLKIRVDALSGAKACSGWLLPLRDILSFLVYGAAFFVRSVDWRGARLNMEAKGRIAPTRSD